MVVGDIVKLIVIIDWVDLLGMVWGGKRCLNVIIVFWFLCLDVILLLLWFYCKWDVKGYWIIYYIVIDDMGWIRVN